MMSSFQIMAILKKKKNLLLSKQVLYELNPMENGGKNKQKGHEALNRSPEYAGQSQTFNFEI